MHCSIGFYSKEVMERFIGLCLTESEECYARTNDNVACFFTERNVEDIAIELEDIGFEMGVDYTSIYFAK